MKANFKNIGPVSNAEIELNGVTVVSGANGSGKTMLAKTLYLFLDTLGIAEREELIKDDLRTHLNLQMEFCFNWDLVSRRSSKGFFSLEEMSKDSQKSLICEFEFTNQEINISELSALSQTINNVVYLNNLTDLETYAIGKPLYHDEILRQSSFRCYQLVDNEVRFKLCDIMRKNVIGQREISENISEIIDGYFKYDNRNATYTKNEHEYSLKNISQGMTIFGILQLLLKNYSMVPDLFLIIDDPETSLHPVWRVKLAEIIVKINKELGTRFLINSNSSNFVEAIKLYSELYESKEQTRFYLTEKSDSESYIVTNVTNKNRIQRAYNSLNGSLNLLDEGWDLVEKRKKEIQKEESLR